MTENNSAFARLQKYVESRKVVLFCTLQSFIDLLILMKNK